MCTFTAIKMKESQRLLIQKQTEEFLKKGGKIYFASDDYKCKKKLSIDASHTLFLKNSRAYL